MVGEEIPTGWGLSLYGKDDEKYEQFLRLMRIAIPSLKAELMAQQGWTVEKVAVAKIEEIARFSGKELAGVWIHNAIRLLEQGF